MHILSPNFSFDGVTIEQVIDALPLSDDDYAFYRDFFIAPNSNATQFIEFIHLLKCIKLNCQLSYNYIYSHPSPFYFSLRHYSTAFRLSMVRLERLVNAMGLEVVRKGRYGKCVTRLVNVAMLQKQCLGEV